MAKNKFVSKFYTPLKTTTAIVLISILYFIFYELKFRKISNCPTSLIEELIENDFNLEVHEVSTSDGYILKLFRLRNLKTFNNSKKPIFMQHGLGSTSATFLMNEREVAPAKLFADKG